MTATDTRLEQAILALLGSSGSTLISPNDAARTIGKGWRALSERARDAARRLSAQGRVSFVQGGREVDASSAKGPVQLRLRRS